MLLWVSLWNLRSSDNHHETVIKQLFSSHVQNLTSSQPSATKDLLQDLEITSNHNPNPIMSNAASKRVATHVSNDSTPSRKNYDCEHSSAKLKKLIKLEK
ncbi:unnamed protein product [Lathyrus oleraceus]